MKYIFLLTTALLFFSCSHKKKTLENLKNDPSILIGSSRSEILKDLGDGFTSEYIQKGFNTKQEWSDANQQYRKVASWWAYDIGAEYLMITFKGNKCIKATIVTDTGQDQVSPVLSTIAVEEIEE